MNSPISRLKNSLAQIADPRSKQGISHPFAGVLALVLLGKIGDLLRWLQFRFIVLLARLFRSLEIEKAKQGNQQARYAKQFFHGNSSLVRWRDYNKDHDVAWASLNCAMSSCNITDCAVNSFEAAALCPAVTLFCSTICFTWSMPWWISSMPNDWVSEDLAMSATNWLAFLCG